MGSKARHYTEKTIKRLFGLSGNECSFPGCTKVMVNENNAKDSNICHIEGANEGSERYRVDMSDFERASYENLILLCVQHHDETNDVGKYTVQILKDMKDDHIKKHLGEKIKNKPSMIRNTINAISSIDIELEPLNEELNSFNISKKLDYNSVIKYAPLIQEYKVYHHKLNSLYDELESQGSLKKDIILKTIRTYYLQALGSCSKGSDISIEEIRKNSDKIIDKVIDTLFNKLEDSELFEDDIIFGINLVVVDAFMRCKILEEPK